MTTGWARDRLAELDSAGLFRGAEVDIDPSYTNRRKHMTALNVDLPDLPTGLPQILTPDNSDIAGRGLGIVLAGRRLPGDGPTAWRVLVFRGLDQYDSYVVWTIWKETRTDKTPFRDVWFAINGAYTDDLTHAAKILTGEWDGITARRSPAL